MPLASIQPARFHFNTIPHKLEYLSNLTAIVLAILGFTEVLNAKKMLIASITMMAASTVLNWAQGNIRVRKYELIVQAIQWIVFMTVLGHIQEKSLDPAYDLSTLLLSLTSPSILLSGAIEAYRYQQRNKLFQTLKQIPGVDIAEVEIAGPDGPCRAFKISNPNAEFEFNEGDAIEVGTYNTALMISPVSSLNQMRDPVIRSNEMANIVHRMERRPHIFTLQEVFSDTNSIPLLKKLVNNYGYVVCSVAPFPGRIGLGSGLGVASDWDFDQMECSPLGCSGEDGAANKSVLAMKIAQFTVVTAHLGNTSSRLEQAEQLLQIVKKWEGTSKLIITGDFNLTYEHLEKILQGSGLKVMKACEGTFYKITKQNWNRNQTIEPQLMEGQLDHIIVSADLEIEEVKKEFRDKDVWGKLKPPSSDHRPLFAKIHG